MSYRPICDLWILARPKVAFYGAYPSGFLARARALLGVGIADPVLHVCAGQIRDYPYDGLGPADRTLDISSRVAPDYLQDARDPYPEPRRWAAILADPPYTPEDHARYGLDPRTWPSPREILSRSLEAVRPGGRVGLLHTVVPRPPDRSVKLVAVVGVWCGYDQRMRIYSVFERQL